MLLLWYAIPPVLAEEAVPLGSVAVTFVTLWEWDATEVHPGGGVWWCERAPGREKACAVNPSGGPQFNRACEVAGAGYLTTTCRQPVPYGPKLALVKRHCAASNQWILTSGLVEVPRPDRREPTVRLKEDPEMVARWRQTCS